MMRYRLDYTGPPSLTLGSDMAVGWQITREDGGLVPMPSLVSLVLKDSAGAVLSTQTLAADQSAPAVVLTFAALIAAVAAGTLDLYVALVIGSDTQTVALLTRLVVS